MWNIWEWLMTEDW